MFDDNTEPVYLKNRNFAESAYRRQQQLQPSALQLADLTFNSKANIEKNTSSFCHARGWGMAASLYRHRDLSEERCRPLPRFEPATVRIATDALERSATPSPET
ncbi:gustatory receptor for sugar taste 64f-like [Aphis craccivora]|uniref:Gustatory receptor for sugar taste 64f-like n=1 Tax=Aphis craccivora TaxID=307492 RepID=A0A6G0YZY5_APHCR|nr:gustatory receptor for sugar taste 64f-like [Aphis craccivora]